MMLNTFASIAALSCLALPGYALPQQGDWEDFDLASETFKVVVDKKT